MSRKRSRIIRTLPASSQDVIPAQARNPVIRAFGERLAAQGKKPKVIITACMRKLLVILNTILKNNTPWRDLHAC